MLLSFQPLCLLMNYPFRLKTSPFLLGQMHCFFFSNVPNKYDELPNDFQICWTSKITKNIHIKVTHNYIYHYMLAIFSHIFYMCSSLFHHLFLYSYRDQGWGGGHLLGLRQVRLIGSSWCALEPWSVNATCWRPRRRGVRVPWPWPGGVRGSSFRGLGLGPAVRWWVFFPLQANFWLVSSRV